LAKVFKRDIPLEKRDFSFQAKWLAEIAGLLLQWLMKTSSALGLVVTPTSSRKGCRSCWTSYSAGEGDPSKIHLIRVDLALLLFVVNNRR